MKLDLTKKVCIVGTGGFARETLCCLIDILDTNGLEVRRRAVFLDHEEVCQESEIMGVPVIRNKDFTTEAYQTIVAIANPKTRAFVVNDLPDNTKYISLIHPTAVLSAWVTLGEGCIVTAGCVLTCNIKIGNHAQLNLNTTIGHDCKIGHFFTTAPAVSISGNCSLGNHVYFGSNSAIRQGLHVCDDVTVGMGGVVVSNINNSGVYAGVPVNKILP